MGTKILERERKEKIVILQKVGAADRVVLIAIVSAKYKPKLPCTNVIKLAPTFAGRETHLGCLPTSPSTSAFRLANSSRSLKVC